MGTPQMTLEQIYNTYKRYPRMWERVCSVYPNFNEQDCMALYESMPQRINVVLKNRGH
jgi:hypothetical protein